MKKKEAELEWYRKQKIRKPKEQRVMRDEGSTPPEDLALVDDTEAMDTWMMFQTKYRGSDYKFEDDDTAGRDRMTTNPEVILPAKFTANKSNHPDYKPGPVKVYTQAEIDEYEENKDE